MQTQTKQVNKLHMNSIEHRQYVNKNTITILTQLSQHTNRFFFDNFPETVQSPLVNFVAGILTLKSYFDRIKGMTDNHTGNS